jgi:hypothetical protein
MTPRTSTHWRRHMRVAVLAAAATIGNDGKTPSATTGMSTVSNTVTTTWTAPLPTTVNSTLEPSQPPGPHRRQGAK